MQIYRSLRIRSSYKRKALNLKKYFDALYDVWKQRTLTQNVKYFLKYFPYLQSPKKAIVFINLMRIVLVWHSPSGKKEKYLFY